MLSNKTKNEKIIADVRFADGHLEKLRGLMFERESNFNYALVFDFGHETIFGASIHMLFVFFPIDVIYLDKDKKVVEIRRALKPFTANYTPRHKSKYLIELPAGKARNSEIGDILEWGSK